jgi:nitrogen regulatory protein PII
MKMITAIIQPFMLVKVEHQLEAVKGFPGMTVTDVRGFGREKTQQESGHQHRTSEDATDFVKKVRIDIAAPDAVATQIVNVLVGAGHTGNPGDGKVFVWPLETAIRIRTGEAADAAL